MLFTKSFRALLVFGLPFWLAGVTAAGASAGEKTASPANAEIHRASVEEMKSAPRGPFERIRWFCKDGTVHPPKPYPCTNRGGGIQHGEWNKRTRAARGDGYAIANVLADLDRDDFVGPDAQLELLKQILIERFLIGWDDGWIIRAARSYRGALQSEDEEAGARDVVLAILADPRWREDSRFFLVREAVRLLPVRSDESSATLVRQLALRVADDDPNFMSLRAKIHSVPEPGDAASVRTYASERGKSNLAERYEELAREIDDLYASSTAASIEALAGLVSDSSLAAELRTAAQGLENSETAGQRFAQATRLLGKLRDIFGQVADAKTALAVLDASLTLEDEVYASGNALVGALNSFTREQRLWLLEYSAQSLYGAGFLTKRHVGEISATVQRLERTKPGLNDYRAELRYLARVPEWCDRWIAFNFGGVVSRWVAIEPQVVLYSQDRLRGSPLLFYSMTIDGLVMDADQLAGLRHDLFGKSIGTGLRALNPGLSHGSLRSPEGGSDSLDSSGIYLLPETTSELPRVAGILTEGEGSSLSHVQLLARNLGIPNVVVGRELLPRVREQLGKDVVLAVSSGGVVQLSHFGPRWEKVFGLAASQERLVIRPDLEKLDLESHDLLPLDGLRAVDSGRTSGPKGANLGELKHAFGFAVPDGFVVPFGVFRDLLDQPLKAGGPSVFEWMKEQYVAIGAAAGSPEEQELVSAFLSRLQTWILEAPLPAGFEKRFRAMLEKTFGADGSFGVFVRSDTNVEDLPGFTGAGLNLTVPNVVGNDQIVEALHRVWASPFTERSYGWRQNNMVQPEYVFPAVVIQRAVASEKSGVMVTTDVEGGGMRWLSVAVNEGVGGAVEGQATESLRIDSKTGEVQFLSQATAPLQAALASGGGVRHVPASGSDTVLEPAEIAQLVELAQAVPKRFPSLRNEDGSPVPADIEFAFRGGRLILLQIRPFVENRRAQSNDYLVQLDKGLKEKGQRQVDLSVAPEAERE